MDTSDDALGLGGGDDLPPVTAQTEKRTAGPTSQLTDQQRRRRRNAGVLRQGFTPPRLSQPGLLGLPGTVQ